LIVGGDKDNSGKACAFQFPQDAEAIEFRHLHVQKDQVGDFS
jgi:hypothetical protein